LGELARHIYAICFLITVALGVSLGAPSPASAEDYSFTTIAVPGASATFARGINDAGDIVGQYSVLGETTIHSFLLARRRFTTIDYPGAYVTVAHGINKAGWIVGTFNTPGGTKHRGFRRDPSGDFTVIDVPDSTYSDARGINTSGEIAGWFSDTAAYHGFLLSGGHYTPIDVAGAAYMEIHAINDSGQTVGYVYDGMRGHGVLVPGGTIDAPGGSSTSADGINNAGEIVGTFTDAAHVQHGFVRDTSGGFKTIDPPGSRGTNLLGINNAGQIVGWFSDTRTQNGFLGTPRDFELIIAPTGYDDWLPEGSLDEGTPGGLPLSVRAVLQKKGGGPPRVKATTMTFRLTTVSNEPGIAINYPRYPPLPARADLRFTPANNPSPWVITDDVSMQLAPGAYTEATGRIASFDFGAYGDLEVTATTEDGDTVVGHLAGQEDKTQLVIPKRAENSFIADKWKDHYGAAAGSDDADLDDEPVGSGKTGDYLTAYEEYRGVFEVIPADPLVLGYIRHVRTDPRKKDVFIRDIDRIGLFYFTTGNLGAPVHVLSEALWDADRVVNYNHDTAHVNDQRGIKVTDGGFAPGSDRFGETSTQSGGEPYIPNTIATCIVYRDSVRAENAELTKDVLATDTVLPYRLKPGGAIYRPAGGGVRIGTEEIDYDQARVTGGRLELSSPSPRGEAHARGAALSCFISEHDVEEKILGHEAGHAVGLEHFETADRACGGTGENIMSSPMCAGSINGAGFWPVFRGVLDARAGQFEVVQ
jgi:hypothetical protein